MKKALMGFSVKALFFTFSLLLSRRASRSNRDRDRFFSLKDTVRLKLKSPAKLPTNSTMAEDLNFPKGKSRPKQLTAKA